MLQRVKSCECYIDNHLYSKIGKGILVFLGIGEGDNESKCIKLAQRIPQLRIFEDEEGKMSYSLEKIKGEIMVIPNFTLYGDLKKGLRPDFTKAEKKEIAKSLYERFVLELKYQGIKVAEGSFGARMLIKIENDGPVTFILEE
ncbi:MAG: D-aminoacyl-tRNA deacylase [candidate division WOR-3 bacterium]|nr:D-aminoacyl-tRNA deacylase [candidate division WOR-3 bacterium]MCX7836792.1 D-aminoacyl-tRNA deacylase [candidate division WOR-3 bacterium]MDW8113570.1 D-aminoacyl-tRNA deacylase [candidate division WOR-3 bacterium]